jgi:hypothetical protein
LVEVAKGVALGALALVLTLDASVQEFAELICGPTTLEESGSICLRPARPEELEAYERG